MSRPERARKSRAKEDRAAKKANKKESAKSVKESVSARAINSSPNDKSSKTWFRSHIFENWRFSEFVLLGGVFSLGVLILVIHLATWGVEARRDYRELTETECEVVGLATRARTMDDGKILYRPEITIAYQFDGKPYKIATYDRSTLIPDKGFIYDHEGALNALLAFPPKTKTQCWVYADDPEKAFLVKSSYIWGWVFLCIPVSLILFGGIWMIIRIREMCFSKEALANERRQIALYPTVPCIPPSVASRGVVLARRLPCDVKSSFRFSATVIGASLWNLASWGAFICVLLSAETKLDYWTAGIFFILFCGIGSLFIFRTWREYQIERVVGSIALETSMLPIIPGRKFKCCLFLKGRIEAKRLDVIIRCEEVARYLQGTNAICNRCEVISHTIFTKYDVNAPKHTEQRELFSAQLPDGVVPSFVAENNEIVWKIIARVEFADGGTFSREFAIVVVPSSTMERD